MFSYLYGDISLQDGVVIVDCSGVGYMCYSSDYTISSLSNGEKHKIYTFLNVREDIFDLYGFLTMEELSCFKLLISVSGVGPRAALSILSVSSPDKVLLSIVSSDIEAFTCVSGIGKKIAGRIILELKDKISKGSIDLKLDLVNTSKTNNMAINVCEAVNALIVLGYSRSDIMPIIQGMDEAVVNTDDIIRYCLKCLAKQIG